MIKRLLASLIGVTGLGYAYDNYTQSYIVERNFRTAKCLLYILYEYKMNFYPENYLQVHEQVAKVIIDSNMRFTKLVSIMMGYMSNSESHWLLWTIFCPRRSSSI